jgi:sugar phosphate isomerase/epimerase
MTRRSFLAAAGAAATTSFAAGTPPRSRMGIASTCYMIAWRPKDSLEFLEHCDALGAGGVQTFLSSQEPDYCRKFRARAEQSNMYVEVMVPLPKGDIAGFEKSIVAAQEAGAGAVRAGALSGRRYESFPTLEDWKKFVADSHAAIERAVPVLERHKMPLALENHKDWTIGDMLGILKSYSSEYLGVCIDTGNNISLLDDPIEVVRAFAPYAVATHVKDMGVSEYPDGFLLSEMPLGDGMLNMEEVVQTIQSARPNVKITLEMITRDPLKVPCLTDQYWKTFPDRSGKYLADTLAMVRKRQQKLPALDGLSKPMQLRLEDDNVKHCLNYARNSLNL